ncbi:hypothetical protein [Pedobacter insulae]|uniref:Lipoprotein n=1 Tax=Pedobacter insulae TaxID=414048 RepID=A0A1I2ZDE0_9SPHI|nr:hypothetical protein [Pedobacter insulae]SFH35546.1 hypothetical protein SAMN04489864_109156 [Pedobacter insulae]
MKTSYLNITFALATLTSCHILQKDKLTLKNLAQKEQLQLIEQRNTLSEQSHLVLIDSSHNDFKMTLWPKGKFTYSLAKGFEGEAEKIMITGVQARQKVLKLKQETKHDSTKVTLHYQNEAKTKTISQKNKFNVGYSWGWVIVLVIILVAIWVYRKLKW